MHQAGTAYTAADIKSLRLKGAMYTLTMPLPPRPTSAETISEGQMMC